MPSPKAAERFIAEKLNGSTANANQWAAILALAMQGQSFSDIDRDLKSARRAAALNGLVVDEHLASLIRCEKLQKQDRIKLAAELVDSGLVSQRRARELTGVARDTIRGRTKTSYRTGATEAGS